ncbi:hypothetical protein PM082_006232 [Marasmius tenuissimus]|nr:hypothetical protein PM082_006232 [Marasmius tenuissimus]
MDEQEEIIMQPARDQNFNFGFGNFTVNNNTVIQQKRSRHRYITGTEEEEAEYDEYHEIKRSDIRLNQMIYRERVKRYDEATGHWIPTDCERSTFLGEIVSGDQKGTIVTVEAYKGSEASEDWRKSFLSYSGQLRVNNAPLFALNRSKVPLLIFSGGLVPIAHFGRNVGVLGRWYLYNLRVSSRSSNLRVELQSRSVVARKWTFKLAVSVGGYRTRTDLSWTNGAASLDYVLRCPFEGRKSAFDYRLAPRRYFISLLGESKVGRSGSRICGSHWFDWG